MEKTPSGTSVGVDDPYDFAGRCDHVTSDGRCRFAFDHAANDPLFTRERRRDGYDCPVVEDDRSGSSRVADDSIGLDHGAPDHDSDHSDTGRDVREPTDSGPNEAWTWRECPHYRSRTRGHRCVRCGLRERPGAGHERPLLAEHHLSYAGSSASANRPPTSGENRETTHEITVSLCRWCHAKVHDSWARIDDDASPATEAIAAREGRRSHEYEELAFETAAERRSRK